MSGIKRQEVIEDDALVAPLVLKKNMEELLGTVNVLIDKFAGMSQAISSSASTGQLKKATTELTAEQVQLAKVTKQLADLEAKNTDEYRKQQAAIVNLKKELKEKQVLGERDATTINKTNASLVELRAALDKNRVAYANLRSEEARNTKEGQALLAVIQQQDKELKDLSGTIGKHQDNVGDYEGAMKRLKLELKAAKDEMAGIAVTLGEDTDEFRAAQLRAGELKDQIGDLNEATAAVSGEPLERLGGSFDLIKNKLGALDFKGAQNGVKQFAAASKDLTFKQATQGLGAFTKSVGTLGKALLTNPLFLLAAAIAAIVFAVVKLKDNIKPLALAFDLVGGAIDFVVQKGKDFLDFLGLSTFAADEKADAVVAAANKEIEAIEKRYDKEIKLADSAGRSTTDLEKKKWEEIKAEAKKGSDELFNQFNLHNGKLTEEQLQQWKDYVDIIDNANTEIKILESKAATERENRRIEEINKQKEAVLKEKGDLFKLQQFRLQIQIETQDKILANIESSEQQKFQAVQKGEELRRQLAFLEASNALATENLTSNGRQLIREQLQQKLFEIEQQGITQRDTLQAQEIENEKKLHDERIANARAEVTDIVRLKQQEVDTVLNAIKTEAIEGRITREEAEKEITATKKDLADDVVQANIDALTKLYNFENLTAEERKEIDIELFKLRSDLNDALLEQVEYSTQSQLENIEEMVTKVSEIFVMFSSSVGSLLQSFTERNLENIQMQENALNESLQRELEIAGTNEQAKAEIREKFARDLEALEKKKLQQQQKAAIYDKAISATQAAIGVALAVIKAGVITPLAIATGIAGAISVASILAKPIPKFEKGGVAPGGNIMVGEAGVELMKEPGGSLSITPPVPTILSDVPKGTRIFNNKDTIRMLASNGVATANINDGVPDNSELKKINKQLAAMEYTFKTKKEVHINFSRKGVESLFKKGNSITNFLNDYFY